MGTEPTPTPPTPQPSPPEPAPTPAPAPPPTPPPAPVAPAPTPRAPEPATAPAPPATAPAPAPPEDEPLRAPGMRALEQERDARRAAEREKAASETGQANAERRANLVEALGERGIAGARMKAAMRLVDVGYDEQNMPVDLDGAITKAEEAFDTQFIPSATPTPSGRGNGSLPNVHGGPRPSSPAEEEAQFAAVMRSAFPSLPSTTQE